MAKRTGWMAALALGLALTGPVAAEDAATLRNQAFERFAGADDKSEAIALFEQAAEAGDAASMAFLGDIYLGGTGVAPDRAKAVEWYLKAVQAGHPGAAAKLSQLATGTPAAPAAQPAPAAAPGQTPARTPTVAPAGSEPAPSKSPPAPAVPETAAADAAIPMTPEPGTTELRDRGIRALYMQDYRQAFDVFTQGAKRGDPVSMRELGRLHLAGRGAPRDRAETVRWWRLAAERQDPLGTALLAGLYKNGMGVEKDADKARALYAQARDYVAAFRRSAPDAAAELRFGLELAELPVDAGMRDISRQMIESAARRGSLDAMLRLARQSRASEALPWWMMAADAGDVESMFQVGRALEFGLNIERDSATALTWYKRAADAGHDVAASRVRFLTPILDFVADSAAQPGTDRWTRFLSYGTPAVGIAGRDGSRLYLACHEGGVSFNYDTPDPLPKGISKDGRYFPVLDNEYRAHWLTIEAPMGIGFYLSMPELVEGLVDDVAKARGAISMGFGDPASTARPPRLIAKSEFSARGSTAAVADIRAFCKQQAE